jgi:hypothetical protein
VGAVGEEVSPCLVSDSAFMTDIMGV